MAKNYIVKVRISTNQPDDVSVADRQATIAKLAQAIGQGNILGLGLPGGGALTRVVSAKVTGDSVAATDADFIAE